MDSDIEPIMVFDILNAEMNGKYVFKQTFDRNKLMQQVNEPVELNQEFTNLSRDQITMRTSSNKSYIVICTLQAALNAEYIDGGKVFSQLDA